MESWILTTVHKYFLPVTFTLIQLLFISNSTSFRIGSASNFDQSCKSHTHTHTHTHTKNFNVPFDYGLVGCDNVSTRVHETTFRRDLLLPSLCGAFAQCLYLFGYPNSLKPFHLKPALLWWSDILGNNIM